MESNVLQVPLNIDSPILIKKWKVREGVTVSARQVILMYVPADSADSTQLLKYKSNDVGTVKSICSPEGTVVKPG